MFKKILVTGSEGFIGSHLVEKLIEQGFNVKAFVLYNSFDSKGWLDTLPHSTKEHIETVYGDIRDYQSILKAMKGCDAVLHLAALIAIPYSYNAPASYVDVNVKGTLNVMQAAHDLGIKKIVHTSTSEVYGSAQFVPITEEHPLVGQSPYSASKIGADQIALSFYLSFGTPIITARPFNTYGPRQSTRAVIPTIISQLTQNKGPIKLGALHTTRDFNYCTDTVDGIISILKSDALGEVINIGSGYEISVNDLYVMISDILGVNKEISQEDSRLRPEKSEVERLCAANKKIFSLTDWKPAFHDKEGLKKGLEKTVEWFLNPENLKHYQVGSYTL